MITNFETFLEKITLNIEKGDLLLGGRWKNKKVKINTIGSDINNQVTVNGKPLLKFRINKMMPKNKQIKENTETDVMISVPFEKVKRNAIDYVIFKFSNSSFDQDFNAELLMEFIKRLNAGTFKNISTFKKKEIIENEIIDIIKEYDVRKAKQLIDLTIDYQPK